MDDRQCSEKHLIHATALDAWYCFDRGDLLRVAARLLWPKMGRPIAAHLKNSKGADRNEATINIRHRHCARRGVDRVLLRGNA